MHQSHPKLVDAGNQLRGGGELSICDEGSENEKYPLGSETKCSTGRQRCGEEIERGKSVVRGLRKKVKGRRVLNNPLKKDRISLKMGPETRWGAKKWW